MVQNFLVRKILSFQFDDIMKTEKHFNSDLITDIKNSTKHIESELSEYIIS